MKATPEQLAATKKWRLNNPDKIKEYSYNNYWRNPEAARAKAKRFYDANFAAAVEVTLAPILAHMNVPQKLRPKYTAIYQGILKARQEMRANAKL